MLPVLVELMQKYNITQVELAKKENIAQSTVSFDFTSILVISMGLAY